jgi:drug/metabolite transporter (DMT)-like permease
VTAAGSARPAHPSRASESGALFALLGVQLLFGLHYLAAKTITETIPPRPWALMRAASAGLVLLLFLAARRMPLPRGPGTFRRFLGLGLLGVAINQWLFVEGLHRTTPGHSALINTSMPVLVVLIALVMGRERPTPLRLARIAITMVGVLWLVAPGAFAVRAGLAGAADSHLAEFRGDLMTTVNSLSYSLFLVVSKPVFERERTLPAAALLLLCGALWLLPLGLPGLLTLDFGAIGVRTWLLGAFIVLGPTVGAYALNTFALKRLDASVVAFFIFLQPLIATTLSIARGYERPTPRLFVAAAIVFTGVFVALRAPAVRAAPPLTPES